MLIIIIIFRQTQVIYPRPARLRRDEILDAARQRSQALHDLCIALVLREHADLALGVAKKKNKQRQGHLVRMKLSTGRFGLKREKVVYDSCF